jgi:dipeptidyl aminopeptidase/acylaminoacyl peptidase
MPAVAVVALFVWFQPSPRTQQAAASPRAVELTDIIAWKTIGGVTLSNDGQWLAYRLSPGEGDAQLIVRRTRGTQETRFEVGEVPGAEGGGPTAVTFSDDSKWIAFNTNPSRAEAQRLRRQRRPVQAGVTVVNLESGEKREYARVRRFEFSGDTAAWIALHRQAAPAAGAAGGGAAAGGRGGASAAGAPANEPARGTDLILRQLANGQEINVGNVSAFEFTRDGTRLAMIIDAQDKVGNGVLLRDLSTGATSLLDGGAAIYERLTLTEEGDALAVLKGTEDRTLRDKVYSVVGVTGLASASPAKTIYTPSADSSFPEGLTISGNREARWTEDREALLFGIHIPRKRDGADASNGATTTDTADTTIADRPAGSGDSQDAEERVDLVLWHWSDTRLPTQQEVQEGRDRTFSYLAEYRVSSKTFIRLSDEEVRTVSTSPKDRFAIGFDDREFELTNSLDGRRFQDVYVIKLQDGTRTRVARRQRYYSGPSPDGRSFLFYENGHYFVHVMETGQTRNITQGVPASFIDTEDDHNNVDPPVAPIGWTRDNASVLLSDNWDIWQVPIDGSKATNLTINGRKDAIRYQRRFPIEPARERDEGIDLARPQYFAAYGEWTKKGGIARLDPGKPGVQMLMWGDAAFGRLIKAEDADRFVYTRETSLEPADFFVTDAGFGPGDRLSDMRPQVADFKWSAGVQLVNYTSDKGDKLQAALFLPANYEKGKAYPTVVNFYERMSQTANTFANPGANGFNRSVYTSNGYAVLVPDIAYKVNDPGMSAVWCMVPAVKAAIATGIVDPKHIGITGHSWGGYQTAFLITQTDIFAAAVAGAPLTNMVSMYSLVYKNTGGTNQSIFESSQGRFKGGYWDNWDAYYRNSPVFFAKNVKTPLMIMHNDRDGAVDFTQGVEYFNTLRRLQKPVIMLEYVGENHGLRKRSNQRDYTVRMKEFFDHHLKGAPAPEWMTKGVPRLKMEEHLKERTTTPRPAPKPAAPPPPRTTTDSTGQAAAR